MTTEDGDSPQVLPELKNVEKFINHYFKVIDWQAIRIIFATAAGLYIEGEMLWLRLVGASRSGKTELLRAIAEHPDSTEMGALTPAALRGAPSGLYP